jgi:ribosomal protein S20
MPIHKSAVKKVRQDVKRTNRNLLIKRKIKALIVDYKKEPSAKQLQNIQSVLFKAAKDNIFHKNKSRRLLSRLAKKTVTPKISKVKKTPKKTVKKTT